MLRLHTPPSTAPSDLNRYNLTHAGALRTPGDWVQTDIDSLLSLQPEPIGQPGETVEPPEE